LKAVIDAGARTVNIPDTVGYSIPSEWGDKIRRLDRPRSEHPQSGGQRPLPQRPGVGVANSPWRPSKTAPGRWNARSTASANGPATPRSEEIVMALRTRKDLFHLTTGVDAQRDRPGQPALVQADGHGCPAQQGGGRRQRLRPFVGDPPGRGVEIPHDLRDHEPRGRGGGGKRAPVDRPLGSQRRRQRLEHLGYSVVGEKLEILFAKFKALADKKKYVFDDDLLALVEEEGREKAEDVFHMDYLSTTSGTGIVPTATFRLKKKDEVFQEAACGDGPVDAVYRAMDKIAGVVPELKDYQLRSIRFVGTDAQGEVVVKVEHKGLVVTGKGTSTDIVEASAKAYLNALNKILTARTRRPAAKNQGM
jgi:2-isopropylmalate synthase